MWRLWWRGWIIVGKKGTSIVNPWLFLSFVCEFSKANQVVRKLNNGQVLGWITDLLGLDGLVVVEKRWKWWVGWVELGFFNLKMEKILELRFLYWDWLRFLKFGWFILNKWSVLRSWVESHKDKLSQLTSFKKKWHYYS